MYGSLLGSHNITGTSSRVLVFWSVCCHVDSLTRWGSKIFKNSDQRHPHRGLIRDASTARLKRKERKIFFFLFYVDSLKSDADSPEPMREASDNLLDCKLDDVYNHSMSRTWGQQTVSSLAKTCGYVLPLSRPITFVLDFCPEAALCG